MLKLMLAVIIVAFLFVPELVVTGSLFAVDDPWGCRSCLSCGVITPAWANWLNFIGFGSIICGLTFFGVKELTVKNQ